MLVTELVKSIILYKSGIINVGDKQTDKEWTLYLFVSEATVSFYTSNFLRQVLNLMLLLSSLAFPEYNLGIILGQLCLL